MMITKKAIRTEEQGSMSHPHHLNTPAENIALFEAQERLEPGTPGYWKIWGASVRHIIPGDIVLMKDGDTTITEFITGTFTAKAAPMRFGLVDAKGEKFTLGALTPVIVVRWGTHNTLAN
jgi:hypothetical protein